MDCFYCEIMVSYKIDLKDDYYYNIAKKYSIAYNSLIELGKCSINKLEIEFKKVLVEPYVMDEVLFCTETVNIKEKVKDEANGISEDLAPGLIKLLKGILNKEASIIYVDSFKYLSRNFETILKVLQFLLTHDAMFLTNNFLIKNGYVSRRKVLVRASHENNFNTQAIQSIGDVSRKYKKELEKLLQLEMGY